MQGNQIKYVKAKYKSSGSFEEYFGDEFSKPRGLGGNFHRYNSNDESREDFDIDELTFRITDSSESDYSSSKEKNQAVNHMMMLTITLQKRRSEAHSPFRFGASV